MPENSRSRATRKSPVKAGAPKAFLVALLGPTGAGKSTLIRELAARFRSLRPAGRLAIFASPPARRELRVPANADGAGAAADNDPFFARSLPAEVGCTDISHDTPTSAEALQQRGEYDLVLLEFAVGEEENGPAAPLGERLDEAGLVVCVLTPDYDPTTQSQSNALLNAADLIVLNKCDDPRAAAAKAAMLESLNAKGGDRQLFLTVATKGEDLGVEALFEEIADLGGWSTGGEKPCQLRIDA
ncbi:MAG: methylmalonyl-CoA mutase protein [Verrucomicrobiota bacterium]|jgi:putative protein kinase ArgK-like GTPase of G3E family